MEVLLALLLGIFFAISYLLEKVSKLIEQLKSGSTKLSNGFEAKLSYLPIDNKNEVNAANTNFTSNDRNG